MNFILASQSPTRKQLMELLGVPFEVIPSGVDETALIMEDPYELAQALACAKAEDVFQKNQDSVVIGCDTLAWFDGKILGKPKNAQDARATLKALRDYNGAHELISGVCMLAPKILQKQRKSFCAITKVWFKKTVSDKEISAYVASGEPFGKAASYALLGNGRFFIEKVEGGVLNVVGMPLYKVALILREYGFAISKDALCVIRKKDVF